MLQSLQKTVRTAGTYCSFKFPPFFTCPPSPRSIPFYHRSSIYPASYLLITNPPIKQASEVSSTVYPEHGCVSWVTPCVASGRMTRARSWSGLVRLVPVLLVPDPDPSMPTPSIFPCSHQCKTNVPLLLHPRPELTDVEIGLSRKHGYVASSCPRNPANSIDVGF